MTREEAEKLFYDASRGKMPAKAFVDGLEALGLLNLEETKRSPFQELCMRLAGDYGWSHSSIGMTQIESALKDAGLKIVDARSQGEG